MDVRITTRHVDLAQGFMALADERARKLERFEPRLIAMDLVFEDDHGQFSAEARADVPGHPPMIASAAAQDQRAALDRALNKLGRQLRRERSKRVDHQAPPPAVRATG